MINYHKFLSLTVCSTIALTGNATLANPLPQKILISVEFKLPKDAAPRTSVGGGTRGNVQFALPGGSTPRTSVGGGTRGDVQFTLPGGSAPRTSVGGGTRGDVQFTLPATSAPRTSVGGGTRGETIPLTALLPPTQQGRTVSSHPTIFAYLPPIGAEEVFFSLQDEAGNSHYSATLKVPPDGGVVSVTLPPKTPDLVIDKNYLWYFAPIEPGGVLRPDNYAVTGWVKRVKPTFNEQDLAATPVQLATKYAEAGVWYDTLKVLAAAKRSQPHNKTFATEWHDLLKQVGLEKIASEPLIEAL